MKVYKIESNGFGANSFAVTADDKTCILIDCAEARVSDECKRLSLVPRAVLLTHGHFDHVGGCAALKSAGAKIYASAEEIRLTFSHEYLSLFGGVFVPPFDFDGEIKEGETELCGLKIKVIVTRGHTAGGLSYLIGDTLFTGDTLFCGSIGRSDLPTGDYKTLVQSVKKLYALDGDFKVCCGHGENTSLTKERLTNPFVRA